jgi:hypothetical protein
VVVVRDVTAWSSWRVVRTYKKESSQGFISQYIPRVSRRRITGMSNTIHTFMHALAGPVGERSWGAARGLVGSLAFAFAFTLPPGLFRVGLRHQRARVQGGNEGNWLRGASEDSQHKDPEASREQRSWYISCENAGPHSLQGGEMELHRSSMVALFTLRLL